MNNFKNLTNLDIKYFGSIKDEKALLEKINFIIKRIDSLRFYLIIAETNTSQIKGISAAGINSKERRKTALADAEFLLFGPNKNFKYSLPILSAGVSPAVISFACAKLLGAAFKIVPIGTSQIPYFRHLSIERVKYGPSNCLSSGNAMPKIRVKNLYERGLSIGLSSKQPIFICESVPGGTTTAQAVMTAYELPIENHIGSSLIESPRKLKKEIVSSGIAKGKLKDGFSVFDVIASVGDPFQAFAIGILIGARRSNQPVILGGGSQMIAVIFLALEFIENTDKQVFAYQIFLTTTGWMLRDDSLNYLLNLLCDRFKINLTGFSSCLDFQFSSYDRAHTFLVQLYKLDVPNHKTL